MQRALPPLLAGDRRALLARLIANGFLQALAGLSCARLTMYAFDLMVAGQTPSATALSAIGASLAACALALGWLRARERVDAERMGQSYARELRRVLFDVLSRLSLRALQQRRRGSLMVRFIGDLKSLRQWLSLGLSRLTVAAVSTAAALIGLALIDALLAAVALAALATGALVVAHLGRRARACVQVARRRQARLAANLGEKLVSMPVLQLFGQVRREARRIDRQGERLAGAMVDQARAQAGLRAAADVTASLAAAAVLIAGIVQVAAGAASVPQVAAAMTVVGLMVPALRDLGQVHAYHTAAAVSRERLAAFLAQRVQPEGADESLGLITVRGSVEFRNVSFGRALQGFSASAAPGKVTAIVGPNGAGKSTLLALVARLLDPDTGSVLIDGQPLSEADIESVRRSVGMVGADLPLLRGSLERNLRYRWPNAPANELDRVWSLCRIDELAAVLPDGARSRILEGGANLSMGQRQRVALARALLGEPAVLLLDEVDVNLDPAANRIVDEVLRHHRGTVLMVTHRFDRAALADAIWFVDAGRLVAAGTPREMLQHPRVRGLFTAQWSDRDVA